MDVGDQKPFEAYIADGVQKQLSKLRADGSDSISLAELEQNPTLFTNGIEINSKALARFASGRDLIVPSKAIAVSITIEDYSNLRQFSDFAGYQNLKTVRYDREKFVQGCRCAGISDIRQFNNPSFRQLNVVVSALQKEVKDNGKNNQKTFVLFHYGGHGF